MNKITTKLKKWRSERVITCYDYKTYFINIIEELLEPMYNKQQIEKYKNEITNKYFISVELDKEKIIDTINDICIFSINENETMGYDFNKSMAETLKEISSRKQDPQQKEVWEKWGASGKWLKDVNQDESTKYKADYSKCIYE